MSSGAPVTEQGEVDRQIWMRSLAAPCLSFVQAEVDFRHIFLGHRTTCNGVLTLGIQAYRDLKTAGLSFIGLGVRPLTAEWGIMVAEGANVIVSGEWWLAVFPGLTLMIAVLAFHLLLGWGLSNWTMDAL